jgi:hypothetical protein
MKAIKCPNCGSRLIAIERGNQPTVAWMACALDGGCGVRGPLAEGRTGTAAVRLAARLTREWIARMEADKRLDTRAQAAIDAIRDEVTDSANALTEEYMKWQEKGGPRPRDHAYREGRYHGAALSFKILSEAGFKATEATP